MKISQVVWMMVLFFLMSVIAAAQGQGQGPPPGVDTVNCTGCVGTTDIADGAVSAAKVASGAIGTSKIVSAQVQRRVAGSCAIGASIATINEDGTVICETDEVGITAVTASAPLVSSGGNSPNISLPGVIIGDANSANTAIGFNTLVSNTTGWGNTTSGTFALFYNTKGVGNTASGAGALAFNTEGSYNTASGFESLGSNTTGHSNTASGFGALAFNTTGQSNTATGLQALLYNTTGNYNTAGGLRALHSNTTGSSNTASGWQSLLFNTTGHSNTANGFVGLMNNTTGHSNTASGQQALLNNTTGNGNTASGHGALEFNITGNYNTAVGWSAGVASGNLSNATAIGAGAVVDASDKIRLGNNAVSVIEAQVGLTVVSDASKKENFQPVDGEAVLHKIQGLSLTSWNLIGQDPKHFRHYGPIAQEFFAAFGSDGVGTIGNPTTITSTDMDGILMVAAQALEKRTAEQTQEVSRLKTENATLKARLETIEALIREALPQR